MRAMVPVLQAVPNFSEGRDPKVVRALVRTIEDAGAEVLDWSADPDHHRSVITLMGDPRTVEEATVAAARLAVESIDLRRHAGVHPRVGALDVLPFVPLSGLAMEDAVDAAHRVGERLVREVGLPVYFYREAARPPGAELSDLRRGGFEALVEGFPDGRQPDLLPDDWQHPGAHPTGGAVCVGARELLLAWNVFVAGLELEEVRHVADAQREAKGGFAGVRALALALPERGRLQISMNLEDLDATDPFRVFRSIEADVERWGGRVTGTEVIGLIPDALVLPAAADRLQLLGPGSSRLLSPRLAKHVAGRAAREANALVVTIRQLGERVPPELRRAADRLAETMTGTRSPGHE